MDFDIKRRKLRSQLSALGYFDLSGTTLNAFHKSELFNVLFFQWVLLFLEYVYCVMY